MMEPAIPTMKDFVHSEIAKLTSQHEKIISGWRSVEFSKENIRHLFSLFKKCSKQEIRLFEENNFLDHEENEAYELITKKLMRIESDQSQLHKSGNTEKKTTTVMEKSSKKQSKKTINKTMRTFKLKEASSDSSKVDALPGASINSNCIETKLNKAAESSLIQNSKEEGKFVRNECQSKPKKAFCGHNRSETKETEESTGVSTVSETRDSKEQEMTDIDIACKNIDESNFPIFDERGNASVSQFETPYATKQSGKSQTKQTNREDVAEQKNAPTMVSENESVFKIPTLTDRLKRNKNPFDNYHLSIEPLITGTPNTKSIDKVDGLPISLPNHYISSESTALKKSLQKLVTDISTEERLIREQIKSGEPASVDSSVLEEFISRANIIMQETEAVNVKKIAEAETRKFLSSLKVPADTTTEAISNQLMQDMFPKTNEWRSFTRKSPNRNENEVDAKERKKLDEQVERKVRAAIKAAGESLNKKQIGQIRKAAIIYSEFDRLEQQELDFRSDSTLRLAELVSAYEANSRMDELIRLRLAIAFCTNRRDYFLKIRPPDFMQFSYMYIYLLEKINSNTAAICACLNYHSTVGNDFDELEELILNLFHDDYFLDKS